MSLFHSLLRRGPWPALAALLLALPLGVSAASITSFNPTNGVAGTVVTVTGTGLAGTTAVRFGATNAPGFSVSPDGTTLTVSSPAGAFNGLISVDAPGGTVMTGSRFGVDLVLPSGTLTSIPPGAYHDITIGFNCSGALAGPTTVDGLFHVLLGGEFYTQCHVLGGPGQFTLDAGTNFYICDAAGISANAASGAIQTVNLRTYNPSATYVYNGFSAQQTGDGLPASVVNLLVDNAAGLDLTRDQEVTQWLLLSAAGGDLRLGARNLTLASTPGRTAAVTNSGAGQVLNTGTGRTRMQRAVSVNPVYHYYGLGYHHYSSPMQATTVSDFAVPGLFVPKVNPAYNMLPRPVLPAAQYPNIFDLDQSRISPAFPTFETAWRCPTALSDVLVPGKGYAVYSKPAATVDFVGQLTRGDVPTGALPRGFGPDAGWYLVGNPYPSTLDWDVVRATPGAIPGGMEDMIAVFQPTGANSGFYRTYTNGVGTGGFDGLLPSMQGFLIHVTSSVPAPGFTFRDAFRPFSFADRAFHRPADQRPRLTLSLAGPDPAAGPDEAIVYFEAGATATGLDARFDGAKLPSVGTTPTLATRTGGPAAEALAINGLPELGAAPVQVPLTMTLPTAGTQVLTAATIAHFAAGQTVTLEDHLLGIQQDLTVAPTYSFTAAAGTLEGRFSLVFGPAGTVTGSQSTIRMEEVSLWPNPSRGGDVRVQGVAAGQRLTLLDATGRVVRTVAAGTDGATLTVAELPAGVYTVRCGSAARRLVVE